MKRINSSHLRPVNLMKVPVSFVPVCYRPLETSVSRLWDSLVDTGGDVSLIREDVVKELGLKISPCEGKLKGFGQNEKLILGTVILIPVLHGRFFDSTYKILSGP